MNIKKENKKLIIKKDRCLISISNDVTLTQRKIYNALLFTAKKCLFKDKTQRTFEIELSELELITNIKNTNRVYLKKEIKELMTKTIEFDIIDNDDLNIIDYEASTFIASIKIKNAIVKYEFSSLILEMIDKPKKFAILELNQISAFTSKFSLALYEFLKDRKTFIPKITILDCRKMLVGDVKLFKMFADFKKDVLDKATNEITEKTDLIASYELIKHKNTYTHIIFKSIQKEQESNAIKLDSEITEKLIIELNKSDKLDSFKMRYDDNPLEFQIIDKELVIISPAEHFTQWLIDNHFDNKIKNILHLKFNLTFNKVILK
jgi:plasmid replication initiation protein